MMNWRAKLRAWRRLRGDTRGVAAVEFALIIPLVIVVYAGGFEIAQAATVYRKVTDTTVQLANVTSQYTTLTYPQDFNTVFGASSQIMAPYSTTPLTIVMSQVTTDTGSVAKVSWSKGYPTGTPALVVGSVVTMPAGLASPSSNYILVQTTYQYTSTVGSAFIGNIPMKDQIFMIPRESPSIPCPTC
jgi:Flp pilus assembly protein TadG